MNEPFFLLDLCSGICVLLSPFQPNRAKVLVQDLDTPLNINVQKKTCHNMMHQLDKTRQMRENDSVVAGIQTFGILILHLYLLYLLN